MIYTQIYRCVSEDILYIPPIVKLRVTLRSLPESRGGETCRHGVRLLPGCLDGLLQEDHICAWSV